jgi:glycogen(starch) synthase
LFVDELVKIAGNDYKLILAHFHEWMAGLPILDIKREASFRENDFHYTCHTTWVDTWLLTRHLFYAHLPFFRWEDEAGKFGVETEAAIEYGCAQRCDVMTTVSDVTARECRHLTAQKT